MKGTVRAFLVGIVVLSGAALAGCVSEGGSSVAANLSGPGSVPEFDDTTGAIRGQVLDPEQRPLAGADAGILSIAVFGKTDAEGFFALNHVPPGEHGVAVAMLGFHPAIQNVAVVAGESTDIVIFTLEPLPSDAPYHKIFHLRAQLSGVMWKLTPQCIYTDIDPLVKTCGGLRAGDAGVNGVFVVRKSCPVCETHTRGKDYQSFTNEWQTIMAEVTWTAQSGATGKGFQLDVNAPNITRGNGGSINQADKYTWSKAANKAPIAIRIDKDALAARGVKEKDWNNFNSTEARCTGANPSPHPGNCDWFFRLFPAAYDAGSGEQGATPDYGVMLDNVAEIYFSYYIKDKAPEGFTALPD